MRCPGCNSQSTKKEYEGQVIDQCRSCGGAWLDDGELGAIVRNVETMFTEEEKSKAVESKGKDGRISQATLSCPKCSKPLEIFQYALTSGVYIDRCSSKHGIWLDVGELEKIQILVEQGSLRNGLHRRQLEGKPTEGKRRCPRDHSDLIHTDYDGQAIDVCEQCGGTWLDDGELSQIINTKQETFAESIVSSSNATPKKVHAKDLVIDLDCVVCSKPMSRIHYNYNSGVVIDSCTDGHGVWLDHHELERIQAHGEFWSNKEADLAKKYEPLLRIAKAEASEAIERAIEEGRKKGIQASTLGSFFDKLLS